MSELGLVIMVLGVAFCIIAALGLVRMPTFFVRMQVTSKASTLGVFLMVLGAAVHTGSGVALLKSLVIFFFLVLTAPVAAHALAQLALQKNKRE